MQCFIQYLLLFITICCQSSQDFFIKTFKESDRSHLTFDANIRFCAVSSGFEFVVLMLVWALFDRGPFFHLPTAGYSVIFGIAFAGATLFTLLAIAEGSLALSGLVISYSLLMPTTWSIIFDGSDVYKHWQFIVGIVLLCLSLFLIRGKDGEQGQKKITKRWIIYVILAFFSNGVCNIVMDVHQQSYPGQYRSAFLAMSMIVVVAVCAAVILIRHSKNVRYVRKPLVICSSLNGTVNATANLLLMTIIGVGLIPAAVMFPVMSAGQSIFCFLISFILFRERFTKNQYIGYFLGALSVVLLNMA